LYSHTHGQNDQTMPLWGTPRGRRCEPRARSKCPGDHPRRHLPPLDAPAPLRADRGAWPGVRW